MKCWCTVIVVMPSRRSKNKHKHSRYICTAWGTISISISIFKMKQSQISPLGRCTTIIAFLMASQLHIVSAQIASGIGTTYAQPYCWIPCQDAPDTSVPVPDTDCKLFYVCRGGQVTNRLACAGDLAFDTNIGACNHAGLVFCVDPVCDPTFSPSYRYVFT